MAKPPTPPSPNFMHTHWIIPQGWGEGILLPIDAAAAIMTNMTKGIRVRIDNITGVSPTSRIIYPSGEPIDHGISYLGPTDQIELGLTKAEAQEYINVIAATCNLQASGDRPSLPFTYREWRQKESEH